MGHQSVTIRYGIADSHGCKFTYADDLNSKEDAYKMVLEELPSMLKPLHVTVELGSGDFYKFSLDPCEYAVQFLRSTEKHLVLEMKNNLQRLWKILEEYDDEQQ